MMSTKGRIIAVLIGSFSVMNSTHAQTTIRTQVDPEEKLFRMVAPDGTVVAADGVTGRFFIETSAGQSFEFSFDQALAHLEPNQAKRPTLKATFEAALANREMANYSYVYPEPEPELEPEPCQPHAFEIVCEIMANRDRSDLVRPLEEEEEEEDQERPFDLDEVSVTGRRPIMMGGRVGAPGWGYFQGGNTYTNPNPLGKV